MVFPRQLSCPGLCMLSNLGLYPGHFEYAETLGLVVIMGRMLMHRLWLQDSYFQRPSVFTTFVLHSVELPRMPHVGGPGLGSTPSSGSGVLAHEGKGPRCSAQGRPLVHEQHFRSPSPSSSPESFRLWVFLLGFPTIKWSPHSVRLFPATSGFS